jgi:hypothetical protein
MVGTTLIEIREHIDALTSEDGTYYVVCGRTGERPIPTAGKRFPGRTTAQSAARAAEQYRTALRRYDPQLPYYDLVVCQDAGPQVGATPNGSQSGAEPTESSRSGSEGVHDSGLLDGERQRLVEFCHRVAAAVFETLCDRGHRAVETAVMDAYFDLAETLSDPDDLCLCLLESTARELDTRLDPSQQADVLSRAASRLAPPTESGAPVTTVCTRLQQLGLFERYRCSPSTVDAVGERRSVVVELTDYALSPQDGRLPVLPVVVDLFRQRPRWSPSTVEAAAVDGGWRVTLTLASDAEPDGLASAPIRPKP